MVYSVLQELARRDGMNIALSGLSEDQLYPLLKYLTRNLTEPRFTPLLLDVCNIIAGMSGLSWQPYKEYAFTSCVLADIYGCTLSQSKTTKTLFRVLKVKVDREVQFQKHAFQLLGSINTLLTVATN